MDRSLDFKAGFLHRILHLWQTLQSEEGGHHAEAKLGTLSKSFDALLGEKRSLAEKEEGLIVKRNKVLQQIGYRVERTRSDVATSTGHRRRKPQRRRETQKQTDRHHVDQGQKRRGRPPLRKVA